MMVVFSLPTWMRLAVPSSLSVAFSSVSPTFSAMTVAPVRTAMSCSMALRRSPKPGASTAGHGQLAACAANEQRANFNSKPTRQSNGKISTGRLKPVTISPPQS